MFCQIFRNLSVRCWGFCWHNFSLCCGAEKGEKGPRPVSFRGGVSLLVSPSTTSSGNVRKQWLIARTKSCRELWAAENVERQGYEFYLPRIYVKYRVGGFEYAKTEPLFRSYLFVNGRGDWHFLLHTFGVASVLMGSSAPKLLSDEVINSLRMREVCGIVVLPKGRFAEGQEVRIKSGALEGRCGLYQGASAKDRERVLLDFLGRKTSVLIQDECLEAA